MSDEPARKLNSDAFIAPTPRGAYLAVTTREDGAHPTLLRSLLREATTPTLTADRVRDWLADWFSSAAQAIDVLDQMATDGLVQGLSAPLTAPAESLEVLLPDLLAPLSAERRILLADDQGFCLASAGFADERAVELAAMSAELARISARHDAVVTEDAHPAVPPAWALVGPVGNSRLGYWPVRIGDHAFVLVIGGLPRLNHQRLVDVVWSLTIRYDPNTSTS